MIQQLGGGRFTAMTGAKNFTFSEKTNTLSFRIGKNSKGINAVTLTLTPLDLYDMKFYKFRASRLEEVARYSELSCNDLDEAFTMATGLLTHL